MKTLFASGILVTLILPRLGITPVAAEPAGRSTRIDKEMTAAEMQSDFDLLRHAGGRRGTMPDHVVEMKTADVQRGVDAPLELAMQLAGGDAERGAR